MRYNNVDIFSSQKITVLSSQTGGNVEENQNLMSKIKGIMAIDPLIRSAQKGTPLIEIGKGSPEVMLVAGVHGNELPPQIAALNLLEYLKTVELFGKIYLIPFTSPKSTMENVRWFNGHDLNRSCSQQGSITNIILELSQKLNLDGVADFHSTNPKSNPGRESVFCSKQPCINSYHIAKYITSKTTSELICYNKAGTIYQGALEDECNLQNIPAVTCEVVSQNGEVKPGSIKRSFLQMKIYLEHFKILR